MLFARAIHLFHALSNQRAQGKPDARCTRGLVCKIVQKTRTRAYRSSGGNPTFPAQWFTAYHVLSPAIRPWVVTVIDGVLTADLTPALRRQDHTLSLVRLSAVRPTAPPRPPLPRPASVTLRDAPLSGTGFRKYRSDLGPAQANTSENQNYFYQDARLPRSF